MLKMQQRKVPQGSILEIFLLDPLKTTFWMENLSQRWKQSGLFIPKSRHLFQFSKRAGEASPLPLVLHLWVSLNMHQYPWISLISLKMLEETVLNMPGLTGFDRLLKVHQVLNKPGFWIWHGYICKGYA